MSSCSVCSAQLLGELEKEPKACLPHRTVPQPSCLTW
uniref:Uncharacterized protein n=1 Tax=Anguilla anguilla TaxID=7936 RepID=A0A0E9UHH7_ANGAN